MSTPFPRERPRRVHGLQLPLHPLQVTGWAVLAALATGTYFLLLPPLGWTRLPVAIALAVLLLLHVISHLTAAFVDPAEQEVRAKTSRQVGVLDRKKHRHVIEEGHCYLCCITTSGPRTKHCQACNKCVARFDHHCKWLNQCIGGRNYLPFFMCVSSAMAAALLVAAVAVADLFLYHFRPEWFHHNATNTTDDAINGQNRQNYHQVASTLPTSDAAFLAIVGGLGLLAAVTAGLLLHLCFFHIYISFLGLTTYEYIRQQRQTQPVNRTAAIPNGTANGDGSQEKCYPRLKGRPNDLTCNGGRTRTTMFTCTFIQEENICSRPTATPPCTPTGCNACKNEVAPELPSKANGAPTHQTPRKVKRRWNCCMSVPDSPDDVDPRCLMSLCRHKTKAKPKPKPTSPIDGRTPRTHGHWSRVKLRVLFRVLGYLGHHRRRSQTHLSQAPASVKTNQVVPSVTPTVAPDTTSIPTVHSIVPMPSLPPPRRRLVSEAELAAALSILQQQQPLRPSLDRRRVVNRRSRRRSATHRTKSPTLSPIRESGLSNPASPSRQTCGVPLTCSPRQL